MRYTSNKPVYRIAALTDHGKHSVENSIYSIVSQLVKHERCEYVDVISRSFAKNDSFFKGNVEDEIYALRVKDEFVFLEDAHSFQAEWTVRLEDYDIVLMRLPRPVDDGFLSKLAEKFPNIYFVNHPLGIIGSSSKEFLLNFPNICPPIRLCRTVEDVREFASRFSIVLKPLKEYGGKGIVKIKGNVVNDGNSDMELNEFLRKQKKYIEEEGYLAMKYLVHVDEGDKRLLVVDGVILAASLRMPAKGSWLCNVAQGGYAVSAEPDQDEIELVSQINPLLSEVGIMIYGVDTLMGDDGKRVLSEVNTLSIGGFKAAEEQTQRPIIKMLINRLIEKADERFYK